jgi:hypothetical protein
VLDLVLGLAGSQSIREVAPEWVQAGVRHLEEAAHELRARPIEKQGGLVGVAVAGEGTVAITLEEAKGHQRVQEIWVGAWVQPKCRLQFGASHRPGPELGEEPQLDGGEEDLGRPERHADFHDSCGGRGSRCCCGRHRSLLIVSQTIVV